VRMLWEDRNSAVYKQAQGRRRAWLARQSGGKRISGAKEDGNDASARLCHLTDGALSIGGARALYACW